MLEKSCYVLMTLSAIWLAFSNTRHARDEDGTFQGAAVEIGDRAPEVVVVNPDGDSISAIGPGPTLITFFSTSCVYCLASLPIYRKIAQTECGLTMAFVVFDKAGRDLEEWWSANAWPTPDGCVDLRLGAPATDLLGWGIAGTPTHVLVGGDGRVQQTQYGALTAVPEWLLIEVQR